MRCLTQTALAVAFVVLCVPEARGQGDATEKARKLAAQQELKKLEGTWVCVSAVEGKEKREFIRGKEARLTIRNESFMLSVDGEFVEKVAIKVDPSKKPKTVDLTRTEGPEKGDTALGIYELNGDELKLCIAQRSNQPRPTEFTAGDKSTLFIFRRVKEKN
jgi:uncharacterized protein (TIGR03067 family)